MASIEHNVIDVGEIHRPYNWSYADATARLAATGFVAGDVGKLARQTDDNSLWMLTDDSPITWQSIATAYAVIQVACSDETTPIAAGTNKVRFRMPHAMTLTAVRASLSGAASSGTFTVDINEGGSSILSTKLTLDANEKTTTTAATPAVISDSALADDAEISIDVDDDGAGDAVGLKVTLLGTRT